MARRGLSDAASLELLTNNLPSDYNEDTDEGSEEQPPDIMIDPLTPPEINLDDNATTIIIVMML